MKQENSFFEWQLFSFGCSLSNAISMVFQSFWLQIIWQEMRQEHSQNITLFNFKKKVMVKRWYAKQSSYS
jgi:hypothetical protein